MIATILVVEDEPAIADTITYCLKNEGFIVIWTSLGRDGLTAFEQESIDLVILDVGLPDISGFDVCKSIRTQSTVPVLFLTARSEEIDRVIGFEIGGDDYVAKPFSPRELASRVKAILKRSQPMALAPTQANQTGLFSVDGHKACIAYKDQTLELTRYEYLMLKLLLTHPERVFSRTQIMNSVWDSPDHSMDRTVDTHIKSIRAKLRAVDDSWNPVRTHRGLGYSVYNREQS